MGIDLILIRNVLIYGSAILFVVFMNVQGYYMIKLVNILKKKSPKIYNRLILVDFGLSFTFIPRPIRMIKYIWSKNTNGGVNTLIKRVRLFQVLGILFLFMPLIVLILFSLVFGLE